MEPPRRALKKTVALAFILLVIPLTIYATKNLRFETRKQAATNLAFDGEPQFPFYQPGSENPRSKTAKYDGYIVKLKSPSLLEKSFALEGDLQSHKISSFEMQSQFKQHLGRIQEEQKQVKSLIIQTNQQAKIDHYFSKTFSGLSIKGISGQGVKNLEHQGYKVYPNYQVQAYLMDSIPLIGADQTWQLTNQGTPCQPSEQNCLTGQGVKIAIIDTGVDYTHPDLGGCRQTNNINDGSCSKVVGGFDIINSIDANGDGDYDDPGDTKDEDPLDDNGHGTHCAGIAAGKSPDKDHDNIACEATEGELCGVAPDAKIYAYKVLDRGGSGMFDWVMEGIERAVDPNLDGNLTDHVDIISMSLGGNCWGPYSQDCGPEDPVSQAVNNAVRAGVVVVVAAGNSGPFESTIGTPATAKSSIAVGASYKKDYGSVDWGCHDDNAVVDSIVCFSSRGPVIWEKGAILKPDVVAPGAKICAPRTSEKFPDKPGCLDEQHVLLSGTSMATPHVAGLAAILKQKNPDWTPEEIKMALKTTAKDLQQPQNSQGFGRIDSLAAVGLSEKPCVANIETSGEVGGVLNIEGTASCWHFGNYKLFFKYKDSAANWQEFYASTSAVLKGNLYPNFDSSTFEEKQTYVKLEVQSEQGETSQDIVIFNVRNMQITYPKPDYLVQEKNQLEIKGTAYHRNFSKYRIVGGDQNGARLELANGGNSVVINNTLGTLDFTDVSQPGYYHLYLQTELKDGTVLSSSVVSVYIDPFLNKDAIRNIGAELYSPPVAGDINGDGKEEIVFRDFDGFLQVLDSSGNYFPDRPPQKISSGDWLDKSSPALADLDKDGKLDIITQNLEAEYSGMRARVKSSSVSVFYANGDSKKTDLPREAGHCSNNPVVADLNHDGNYETIVACYGGVYILDRNATIITFLLNGLPAGTSVGSSPVVADLDTDGELETIVVVQDQNGRYLNAFNMDGSRVFEPVNFHLKDETYTWGYNFLATGDIDKDGLPEIIISCEGHIYAFNNDGTPQQGQWPQHLLGIADYGPTSLADVDEDGYLEIFVGSHYGDIYGLKHDGMTINQDWPKYVYKPLSSLIEADINNDGQIEIIGGSADYYLGTADDRGIIACWQSSGRSCDSFPKPVNSVFSLNNNFFGTPIISDFDKDGKVDLFFVAVDGSVYLWNFPSLYNPQKVEWPTYQHDPQNTGNYGLRAPVPTPTPISCPDREKGNLDCDPQKLINASDLDILLKNWSSIGQQ